MQDLYAPNLKKNKHIHKWRNLLCSWVGRCNVANMSILSKLIHKSNRILTEIPARTFVDIDKIILEFTGKGRRTREAEIILKKKKKNKAREFLYPISQFQDLLCSHRIKTGVYLQRNRHININ